MKTGITLETYKGEPVCPECGWLEVKKDNEHGFYSCLSCGATWALDRDDPDYEECDDELEVFDHEQGTWKKIWVKSDEY
ncbi:hypothetical protein [Brunnivagina elsteri]|uniref:Uncharacterized protein n=1 Tax=Brunnivagina elsteri CCALA 953 TaxID=987040 RepID=A0A2A2TE72_9CYAN|nr:hypothetical protein [Calothrix elsteri]PAX52054.1 hypothetical protein CK510_21345 [Calothrix elsteri CCALA 953]